MISDAQTEHTELAAPTPGELWIRSLMAAGIVTREDVIAAGEPLIEWRQKLDQAARAIEDGDIATARELTDQAATALGEEETAVVRLRWELHDGVGA